VKPLHSRLGVFFGRSTAPARPAASLTSRPWLPAECGRGGAEAPRGLSGGSLGNPSDAASHFDPLEMALAREAMVEVSKRHRATSVFRDTHTHNGITHESLFLEPPHHPALV
jgi:hypothetical protein